MLKHTGADSDEPALFLRICNSVSTISKAIYLYISGLRFVSVEADLH